MFDKVLGRFSKGFPAQIHRRISQEIRNETGEKNG